jgi:hypothetical protein
MKERKMAKCEKRSEGNMRLSLREGNMRLSMREMAKGI